MQIPRLLKIEHIYDDRRREWAITGLPGEGKMTWEPPPKSGRALPPSALTSLKAEARNGLWPVENPLDSCEGDAGQAATGDQSQHGRQLRRLTAI